MRKLLPLLLGLFGAIAGIGAGFVLKPAQDAPPPAATCNPNTAGGENLASEVLPPNKRPIGQDGQNSGDFDYVKLNNQFVVPVVKDEKVASLVVLSLSLEVQHGSNEAVFAKEPKLRDAFLQVLFDHANSGGFDGAFTESNKITLLRNALREVARKTLGPIVSDVLIMDIVRQDA